MRLESLIRSTPELHARVKFPRGGYLHANGQESINLIDGSRIIFKARTKGGARGFSCDLLIWNEAMVLPNAVVGAMMPTLRASDAPYGPMIIYAGSAVDQEIHDYGVTWARVRERGIAGEPGLAYFEWSAHLDVDRPDEMTDSQLLDRDALAAGEPGARQAHRPGAHGARDGVDGREDVGGRAARDRRLAVRPTAARRRSSRRPTGQSSSRRGWEFVDPVVRRPSTSRPTGAPRSSSRGAPTPGISASSSSTTARAPAGWPSAWSSCTAGTRSPRSCATATARRLPSRSSSTRRHHGQAHGLGRLRQGVRAVRRCRGREDAAPSRPGGAVAGDSRAQGRGRWSTAGHGAAPSRPSTSRRWWRRRWRCGRQSRTTSERWRSFELPA